MSVPRIVPFRIGSVPADSRPRPARPLARGSRVTALGAALLSTVGGCASFGPDLVARDRVAFTSAIGDSQSQQLLLNLLRMRDGDSPVFLDVVSVRTEYSFSRSASLDPLKIDFDGDGRIGLGAGVDRVDEPRITYRPLAGRDFAATMFSPVPAESIMLLTEARRDTEWILLACVERINGLPNDGAPDGPFTRVAGAIHEMQQNGELAFRVHERDGVREATVAFGPAALERRDFMDDLDLDPERSIYSVTSSPMRDCSSVLAIQTRSIATIMQHIADDATIRIVEESPVGTDNSEDLSAIPAVAVIPDRSSGDHVSETRDPAPVMSVRLVRTPRQPADPGVAVEHRGHWYSIARTDRESRSALSLLLQLIAIQDGDSDDIVPVIRLDE